MTNNVLTTMKVAEDVNVTVAEMAICQIKINLLKQMALASYDATWVTNYGTLKGLTAIMPTDHKVVIDEVPMGISFVIETCDAAWTMGASINSYTKQFEEGLLAGVKHALATIAVVNGDWELATRNAKEFLFDEVIIKERSKEAVLEAVSVVADSTEGKTKFLRNLVF